MNNPASSTLGWEISSRWTITLASLGLGCVALVALATAYVKGERVIEVELRYVGVDAEIRDAPFPIGTQLPDYKLKVQCDRPGFWIFNGQTTTLGPIQDTSAKDGLTFKFASDLSIDAMQQITLLEDDKLSDDLVCSVQVTDAQLHADGYDFAIRSEHSLSYGFERIWEGKFGATLLTVATMLGVLFVVGFIRMLMGF